MFRFLLLAAGLHLISTVMLGAGVFALGPPLFVLPVAWYWATGRARHAVALAAVAGLAPLVAGVLAALVSILVAGLGVVLGAMLRRQWPFGRVVLILTALVFVPVAALTMANWEAAHEAYGIWTAARIAEFDAAAEEQSNIDNDQAEALRESFLWFNENWPYLNLGGTFGAVLILSTVITAQLNVRLLRHGGRARATGSFKQMRPPEWLVWVGIALAGCWFLDGRWPNEALRLVTWNGAVALSVVYWLNGLSVMLYGVATLSGGMMVAYAALVVMVTLWLQALPASIGLFETWFEFRRRIDRLVELRRMREQSGKEND